MPTDKIRDSALRHDLTLSELNKPDLGLSIHDSIINTAIQATVDDELKKKPNFGINQIDSIHFNELRTTSEKQSCIVSSDFRLFTDPGKAYGIKCVDLSVDGFLFPFYGRQAIMLNPAFSKVHVRKVVFKNFFLRLFSSPAKALANDILRLGLDNLNGIAKAAKIDLADSFLHKTAISDVLKDVPQLSVLKDDTLVAKVHFYNNYFNIDSGRIVAIASLSYDSTPSNYHGSIPSYWIHPDVIETMNNNYNYLFSKSWSNSFDSATYKENLTIINQNTVYSVLSKALSKLNFTVRYQLDNGIDIPREQLRLFNIERQCNILKETARCLKYAWDKCLVRVCVPFCVTIPVPYLYYAALGLCETEAGFAFARCNSYLDFLIEHVLDIGVIWGNVHLSGATDINAWNLGINQGRVSIPNMLTTVGTKADLKFNFVQNGAAGFLFCNLPILGKVLNFDLSAQQNIPFAADMKFVVEHDSVLSLHLKSDETGMDISFRQSVPELLLANPFDLTLNCGKTFSFLIFSIPIVAATSLIACKVKPDGSLCHFSKDYLDLLFKQLYHLKIDSKEKSVPVNPPAYKLEPYKVSYRYLVSDKYLKIKHLFRRS